MRNRTAKWLLGATALAITLMMGVGRARTADKPLLIPLSPGLVVGKPAAGSVELFGHVTLVEGYENPSYHGFHALIDLRDTPGKTVAVMSTSIRLQELLTAGLSTGNLVAFRGALNASPPSPLGGTWSVDVYDINNVILYGMH